MIIQSVLDTDAYKFTTQNAILEYYPTAIANFRYFDRNEPNTQMNEKCIKNIQREILNLADLKFNNDDIDFIRENYPYFGKNYIEYLKIYRFNPKQHVKIKYTDRLSVDIYGPWIDTVLYEVPILAIISESYFKYVDTNWNMEGQIEKILLKGSNLIGKFSDFGTRRRRSFEVHDLVVKNLSMFKHFLGTSNVYLARKYNIKPIGTVPHEWIQGVSGLIRSVIGANKVAFEKWNKLYGNNLAIALPDTFGTELFFREFNDNLTNAYIGLRQDSGNPLEFIKRAVQHYVEHKINPLFKTIVFSDSLNVEKANLIAKACEGVINCIFGIGTFFTNDFENSKPLNIVIKMFYIDGVPVVKISDDLSKATGQNKDVVINTIKDFLRKEK